MGRCILCGRDRQLYYHKGLMKCGVCLNGKVEPLVLEDFASGRHSVMDKKPDQGLRTFAGQVDRRIRKMGIGVTRAQIKESLFAGAKVRACADETEWLDRNGQE